MTLVRDKMTRNVRVVTMNRTIAHAAETMKIFDVGVLPIVEGDQIVGMITDRDIATRVVAAGKDPNSVTVRDAMTSDVTFCREDEDVQEVAALMSKAAVRRIPVVNDDAKLVGMFSIGDLAVDAEEETKAGEVLKEIQKKPGDK